MVRVEQVPGHPGDAATSTSHDIGMRNAIENFQ